MASLSRQLAQWVVGLRYEDLPPEVVDRAKGVTLHSLASVLLGSQSRGRPAGRAAHHRRRSWRAQRRHHHGARHQGDEGRRRLRQRGDGDGWRQAGTPSACSRIPARASSRAPSSRRRPRAPPAGTSSPASRPATRSWSGMAADFIPTVMARGFHAGPVFGIFGPAVAAAKILRFTEDQVNSTIALCASLAGSNLEGPERRPRPARGRRGAQRHAGGGAGAAGARGRRDRPGRRRRLLSRLRRQQQGPAHLQLRRRHPDQPGQDHRRSREGLAVPRDALPHLLDGRLQHRPRRRHGAALRGAQHQL